MDKSTLWFKLESFVKIVCADRDPTHGFEHMEKVARHALLITNKMNINNQKTIDLIMISAWLHDVADHKYDIDGGLELKVEKFLTEFLSASDCDLVKKIIDRVSFSKENKLRLNLSKEAVWLDYTWSLGDEGFMIRCIVSDADKLEAIGLEGLKRCYEYARMTHPEIKDSQGIIEIVRRHSNDKLLRLLPEKFISTIVGQEMAEKLHQEMRNTLFLNDETLFEILT